MKFSLKSAMALLTALLFITAGCAGNGAATPAQNTQAQEPAAPAAPAAPERVTLEFLAPAPVTQFNDFEKVWEEVYKRTDSFLNVRVNYTLTTFDDVGQRIALKLNAGEQLDGAFVAPWTNPSLVQMISQGLLTNLDSYFGNPQYPGLADCFPADFLEANSFLDSSGSKHVYGVPFASSIASTGSALYYRKDLAEKYGIGEITSYETMIKYFDAILANEPGMYPFTISGAIDELAPGWLASLYNEKSWTTDHNWKIGPLDGTNGIYVAVGDDGKAYASRQFVPEYDPVYRAMLKGPYKDNDPLLFYNIAREWYTKGYFEKDILNQKDPEGQFVSGKAASFQRGLDTYIGIANRLEGSIAGAKIGAFITDRDIRLNTTKNAGSDFMAWNFLAVPTTSKNADRVMSLVNWIYESQENHDLLEYGIEGEHWIADGTDKFSYPEGSDPSTNYNFTGYILTWTPKYYRYASDIPDNIVTAMKKLGNIETVYKTYYAGFTFNPEPVQTELTRMNDVVAYRRALGCGVPEDINAEIDRIQKLFDEAGFAKVAEEVERQFNEFLKSNPYEGQ
ncbi:MAG: extracellular solute-binding protein [Clostridiales bacterium]|nr:extracellular solute-binding protein [Clostridiales bacterium]